MWNKAGWLLATLVVGFVGGVAFSSLPKETVASKSGPQAEAHRAQASASTPTGVAPPEVMIQFDRDYRECGGESFEEISATSDCRLRVLNSYGRAYPATRFR